MDRFLRYNHQFQPTSTPTTVLVQAPAAPSFIENPSLEARIACDPANGPSLEATVRSRPVLQSDFGDGTDGFTAINAPSLNTSVKVADDGLYITTDGTQPGRVLTCTDNSGKAEWTDLVPGGISPLIENAGGQARVVCNQTGLPAITATVQGQEVLTSNFGDGTNGYTAIRAPSLNTGMSLHSDGIRITGSGAGAAGSVLTCEDATGLAVFRYPSRLYPTDNNDLYNFIQCNLHGTDISVNYDQPTGKLRILTQATGTPGQVLTLEDSDFSCKWMDPPGVQPLAGIYTSTFGVNIATTPTVLYPGLLALSSVEYWSATVDTTFLVSGPSNLVWALVDTAGSQYGPSVTTSGSTNSVHRLTYVFTFRKVSNVEVRMTATATMCSNTSVATTIPIRDVQLNFGDGVPLPRASKTIAGVTVTAVSRNAYYNVLNWTPTVVAAAMSRNITPDPFDGIVEINAFDLPTKVAAEASAADVGVELYAAEEGEIVEPSQPELLASEPDAKRQKLV